MTRVEPPLNRLAIVGLGLIGGSLALAAKSRTLVREVVGIGRSSDRLDAARAQGIIDRGLTSITRLESADLVVVCTPPDLIARDVLMVLENTSSSTLVTDGGSVKGEIVRAVAASPHAARFVGAHPLAGSHLSGFEHADANLFQDRVCVLTPGEKTNSDVVKKIRRFWEGIGMRISELPADEHDRLLAATSHLPHLAAAALASQVGAEHREFAASGFRDSTRIAGGDPELWTAILSMNSIHLAALTDELIDVLEDFRAALIAGDRSRLRELLQQARTQRGLMHDADAPETESL